MIQVCAIQRYWHNCFVELNAMLHAKIDFKPQSKNRRTLVVGDPLVETLVVQLGASRFAAPVGRALLG
jgi:hypothetical protein